VPDRTETRRLARIAREHAGYWQLAMPLVTGLAVGEPTAAAGALAAAFAVAFVAHEPLLVVLGRRGATLRAEQGPGARRLLTALALLAVATGLVGFALAPAPARVALGATALLGLLVAAAVLRRSERTVAGEVLVAVTLASGGAVVALAARAAPAAAATVFLTWALASFAATVAVRAVVLRLRARRARERRPREAAAALAAVAVAGLAAAVTPISAAAPLALLPVAVASGAVALVRVSPRALGWALGTSAAMTLAVLVTALR
jgi:hypothetical protein